jgi:thiol:disulfide interchange protein DsbD
VDIRRQSNCEQDLTSYSKHPTRRIARLLIVVFVLMVTLPVWSAQERNVDARLIAEVTAIVPGQPFRVALVLEIRPGWHTYWRNPGDSGAPTSLAWNLPDSLQAGDISWPYPERIAYGPLMNFGYHDQVVLPVTIVPAAVLRDKTVTLRAVGEWLVCADICIPERGELTLTLPVRQSTTSDSPTLGTPADASLFRHADTMIPQNPGLQSSFVHDEDGLRMSIAMPGLISNRLSSVEFFPYQDGVIDYPAEQSYQMTDNGLQLRLVPGFDYGDSSSLDGVLVIREQSGDMLTTAIEITPQRGQSIGISGGSIGLASAILFALIGGAILNLMPCVFPVLSIKVLSLVQQAGEHPHAVRRHGWVYAAGVTVSFVSIALVLVALRAAGEQIGWGFQLQSPILVSLLAYLFFLIGLNLSGYFEFGTSIMNVGAGFAGQQGYLGSFSTGVLATVVAAPCTAPFMASAIGFALTQNTFMIVAVFSALGIGMAIPYLLLCYSPALMQRLPRPGQWMVTFKEILAFPMFASVVWLVWVLSQQTGSMGVLAVLSGMVCIALAIWLVKHLPVNRLARSIVSILVLVMALSALSLSGLGGSPAGQSLQTSPSAMKSDEGPAWETYSAARLASLRQSGPVFVNFTAAWCITCKVNESVALSSAAITEAFEARGVRYLKGDWTNEDPAITQALQAYERSGVPLYLLYSGADGKAAVLPQILTESIILNALEAM